MNKKIIVALSGGVDSSVAAALLQKEGYDVEGIFMKNWSPESMQSLSDCPWEQDQADASAVCEHLGIPFRSVNFEREYKERVVDYFLREYAAGRTPNPDVMCNKEIKFEAFLKVAKELGATCIATGHYAQIKEYDDQPALYRGVDTSKDQSYFLYTLNKEQLSASMLPLGGLTKKRVRELAGEFGLPTAKKRDSQGICFIGHIDLKQFLREHLPVETGEVRLLPKYIEGENLTTRVESSQIIGTHYGVAYYTIGERVGAVVDNRLYKKVQGGDVPPLYVLAKDASKGILYVTADAQDLHSLIKTITLESWYGTNSDLLKRETDSFVAQVRYQQRCLSNIKSVREERGNKIVELEHGVSAVAVGQSLVIYTSDGRVVGGGVVGEVERQYY